MYSFKIENFTMTNKTTADNEINLVGVTKILSRL